MPSAYSRQAAIDPKYEGGFVPDRRSRIAAIRSAFGAFRTLVGKTSGEIAGLFAPVDDEHPTPEKVAWAESLPDFDRR